MARRLHEYVKYTLKELEMYTKTEGSCVRKVNTNLHLSLGPYCMADFKHALLAHITRRKVGYYDAALNGIVLDIKNIKVLGTAAAMRTDDARLHVDINADCYVFCPVTGAILNGVVKNIGSNHVGAIIYRVFNVNIRFMIKLRNDEVQLDQEIQFRIKDFNLQNVFPYMEGELLMQAPSEGHSAKTKNHIKFEGEMNDNTVDSGIEKDTHDLDELLTLIKEEPGTPDKTKTKEAGSKRKRKLSGAAAVVSEFGIALSTKVQIKSESAKREPKKRKSKTDSIVCKQEQEESS